MKAFMIYPKSEIDLRLLLNKLQNYGQCNCSFRQFCEIYNDWHLKTFPGVSVSTTSANFRDDWFREFINYISNRNV